MSGGHWDYLSSNIQEWADHTRKAAECLDLMAEIEHELDWGHSSDTCLQCAELRVVAALTVYFDNRLDNLMAAKAVLRDSKQNTCPKDTRSK
jgi:hypothetical protein